MNEEFFKFAMAKIASLTPEEICQGLTSAGIDATIKQYPEPEVKQK